MILLWCWPRHHSKHKCHWFYTCLSSTLECLFYLWKGKLTNKPIKQKFFSPLSCKFTPATGPNTACISAQWDWGKKGLGCLWGWESGDLRPVLSRWVHYLQAVYPQRGLGLAQTVFRSVSAWHLVWDIFQQMCVLGPAHLGTYPFYWRPWGSLEGRMLYCICRRSRLNQRWSSVTALELIVYKAAERSLLNFIF